MPGAPAGCPWSLAFGDQGDHEPQPATTPANLPGAPGPSHLGTRETTNHMREVSLAARGWQTTNP